MYYTLSPSYLFTLCQFISRDFIPYLSGYDSVLNYLAPSLTLISFFHLFYLSLFTPSLAVNIFLPMSYPLLSITFFISVSTFLYLTQSSFVSIILSLSFSVILSKCFFPSSHLLLPYYFPSLHLYSYSLSLSSFICCPCLHSLTTFSAPLFLSPSSHIINHFLSHFHFFIIILNSSNISFSVLPSTPSLLFSLLHLHSLTFISLFHLFFSHFSFSLSPYQTVYLSLLPPFSLLIYSSLYRTLNSL